VLDGLVLVQEGELAYEASYLPVPVELIGK